jgi:ADP-ribose pyrophosphatase YjhB (NUDIX family)
MGQPAKPAGPVVKRIPDGDNQPRLVCDDCGFVNYVNPKVVVGAVAVWEDRVLLCRRAIEPRVGYWTIPAGYLEVNETPTDGALREAREEANAELVINALLAVYSVPRISQVQLIYRAGLASSKIWPGTESQEALLFDWADIPWHELAFPSVHWALNAHREVRGESAFSPRTNPPGESGDHMPNTKRAWHTETSS